jgi:hypothetical protein
MCWKDLENAAPELATFGLKRFEVGVAYLATVRQDGSPRVHPVTPIVGQGHLFLFMEPTSPKGNDLRRDGRYAIHSAVSDSNGTSGEFIITGTARFIADPAVRSLATQLASYPPADRYILFELGIERADSTIYQEGQPVRQHWRRGEGQ